ncbi:hypothetical protein BU14_2843s0001 [Porphyra umbilicalis]|uniref:Uncharacterized protein n=1 Tax=Porphyra umbilicalis TaxID=2786 RepID=A0A1X6NIH0_PORUM|nr:hypothetical protein BU14_2843s0001 [Porphyra umbilicalis]|eukprot:OSX68418.1 hypothetical protein BU14_2843s0001 [Porphyra umbilicalis]
MGEAVAGGPSVGWWIPAAARVLPSIPSVYRRAAPLLGPLFLASAVPRGGLLFFFLGGLRVTAAAPLRGAGCAGAAAPPRQPCRTGRRGAGGTRAGGRDPPGAPACARAVPWAALATRLRRCTHRWRVLPLAGGGAPPSRRRPSLEPLRRRHGRDGAPSPVRAGACDHAGGVVWLHFCSSLAATPPPCCVAPALLRRPRLAASPPPFPASPPPFRVGPTLPRVVVADGPPGRHVPRPHDAARRCLGSHPRQRPGGGGRRPRIA